MTGYQSKKATSRDKLAQPAQEPLDATREAFEKWAKTLPNVVDITRFKDGYSDCNTDYAWAAWQAALAQPAQEPVAWMYDWFCDGKLITGWVAHSESEIITPRSMALNLRPLYTAPPQRPWVDLTDEEISALSKGHMTRNGFARAVLAKSKELNNG